MPLPLRDRKVGAAEYVLKRMKGSDSYDRMKDHNENDMGREQLAKREKPENDYEIGMKQAVSEMMSALSSNDAQSFEKGLRGFVSMMLDEYEQDEELFKDKD